MTNKLWLWWTLALLWCLAAIYISSDPRSFVEYFVLVGVAVLLGIAWVIRLVIAARGTERRTKLLQLGSELLAYVLVGLFCSLGGAETMRFRLSEPALTAYAKSGPLSAEPVTVGLYRFRSVTKDASIIDFHLGSAFLDEVGFSYCPIAPLPQRGKSSAIQLAPAWYKWTRFW